MFVATRMELCQDDPRAIAPPNIKVSLKPHQLAALQRALDMERGIPLTCKMPTTSNRNRMHVGYAYQGDVRVTTNVGILGDMVGYGKTLTALAIIAASHASQIPTRKETTYAFNGRHIGNLTVTCEKPVITQVDHFIQSTLAIVPRGPVYAQWLHAIKTQTNLKVLAIESLITIRKVCPPRESSFDTIKRFFEAYDVVLIKNTTIKVLMQYYGVMPSTLSIGWNRIIIDEAHDIVDTVPLLDYKFLWLISATYTALPQCVYNGKNLIVGTLKDIVCHDNIPLVLVRNDDTFVKASFDVPPLVEHIHVCSMPRDVQVVHPFLNPIALARVNANDIAGAVREMGGCSETNTDLVDLVTKDIRRDVRNKEHELAYVQSLEIPADVQQARIKAIEEEIARLHEKMRSLTERVAMLSTKSCSICYDIFDNPIMLACTHVFCGKCLIKWMNNNRSCPECRTQVDTKHIVAVVDSNTAAAPPIQDDDIPLPKIERLSRIIRAKPDGKFIVFSEHQTSFFDIIHRLNTLGISYGEMKGSSHVMMNVLNRFKNGEIRVILLNAQYAGSGIDLSCASDVILFHRMDATETQAIGRAQRVGRTSGLVVHRLCYPSEIDL